jgi:hypothetical protein
VDVSRGVWARRQREQGVIPFTYGLFAKFDSGAARCERVRITAVDATASADLSGDIDESEFRAMIEYVNGAHAVRGGKLGIAARMVPPPERRDIRMRRPRYRPRHLHGAGRRA